MEMAMDTADYSSGDRVDAWQQVLTDFLVPFRVLPAPEIPFRARLRCGRLGPVGVVATIRTSSVNCRPERLIDQAGDRRLALSLVLAGNWVASEDRSQQVLRPGDLVLWDLARPMTLASSTSISALTFRTPPEVFGTGTDGLVTSAATVLPTGSGLGALITSHLRRLEGLDSGLRPDVAARLGVATVDLLATYLAELCGTIPFIDGADRRSLLHRIKAHIEDRLGEPNLCPATIAAAHHLSVRLLYKLFAADGHTVAGWIRRRRLERTRHDLIHPERAGSSITAVACRWGFTDSAHFSRVFKAAYGINPSDYRRFTPTPVAGPRECALLDNDGAGTVKTAYQSIEIIHPAGTSRNRDSQPSL
ncbi:MAG: helix-turn-helix domain-containing protein [Pseudonocardiaceae bacterium]